MKDYEDEIRKLPARVWTSLYMGVPAEPDRISINLVRSVMGRYYGKGQSFTLDGTRFTVLDYDHEDYLVSWREL